MPSRKARFNPETFLAKAGMGRTILEVPKKQIVFSKGDAGDAVFYIQQGKVKLTVVFERGKEATTAVLTDGDFLAEECITVGQPV